MIYLEHVQKSPSALGSWNSVCEYFRSMEHIFIAPIVIDDWINSLRPSDAYMRR